MASETITQSLLLTVKEGIDLSISSNSPEALHFRKLTERVKAQDGVLCQYWGHSVQDSTIFVWLVDWASTEKNIAYTQTPNFEAVSAEMGDLFILEKGLVNMTITKWTNDASPALRAPVTEFAYFALPDGAGENEREECQKILLTVPNHVMTVGGAVGGAMGWVFESAPETKAPWLHGVYGYPDIATHMRWRETDEIQEVMAVFGTLAEKGLGLMPVKAPGIDPMTGWFHVHLHCKE